MKIGDILPLPEGINFELLRYANLRRAQTASLLKGNGKGQVAMATRKAIMATQAHHNALRDPLEQAKNFLRQKGYTPVCKMDGVFVVGNHRFKTQKELFEFADKRGWAKR